jgi:hypothetical protein
MRRSTTPGGERRSRARQSAMATTDDLDCPNCRTAVPAGDACPRCGGVPPAAAAERERRLRALSQTVAELRRQRVVDGPRARELERRFEALSAALARGASAGRPG